MDVLTTKCVNQTQLDRLRSLLPSDDQLWLDGRLTAGEHASKVKQNKQLDPSSTESGLAVDMVTKIYKSSFTQSLVNRFLVYQ